MNLSEYSNISMAIGKIGFRQARMIHQIKWFAKKAKARRKCLSPCLHEIAVKPRGLLLRLLIDVWLFRTGQCRGDQSRAKTNHQSERHTPKTPIISIHNDAKIGCTRNFGNKKV